jgi:ABC-2 type transport system ATP-binding protein
MATPVLEIIDLKKTYKRGLRAKPVQALKGISFTIEPGTITGFLGANGAGKTTTIKCLFGLSLPDAGTIRYFGKEGLTNEAKSKIGFLPERPYFYEYLTGREFLRFYGKLSRKDSTFDLEKRIQQLLDRVGLAHAGDRPLRSYSKGMLQRIGIAQTLIHKPEFIILDEPQTGLDPDGRHEVREIIKETASEGTAVFFSSHLLPDAEQLCKNLVILKQGTLVFEGATQTLLGRVEKGYRLTTAKADQLSTQDFQTQPELQAAIDLARKAGAEVREVRPLRLTLEEAFAQIGFDRKESRP